MLIHSWLVALSIVIIMQAVAWNWQRKNRNADVVDVTWSLGILVLCVYYLMSVPAANYNQWLVVMVPILWNARLSWYLWRRLDPGHEDRRYQNLRAHWHHLGQSKFALFFAFQASLSLLFSLPAYWVLSSSAISYWQLIVALFWVFGCLIGVSIADNQLHQFKSQSKNENRVCNQGLWRYSRHPNYFFEWLHWWVYPIVLWGQPTFYYALAIVGLMLVFLLKLTGIPFAEQQALKKRGNAYKKYQQTTSAFILWKK